MEWSVFVVGEVKVTLLSGKLVKELWNYQRVIQVELAVGEVA